MMIGIGQTASTVYYRAGGEWQADGGECLGGDNTLVHIGNNYLYQYLPQRDSAILTIGRDGIVDRVTLKNSDKIRIAELDGRLVIITPGDGHRVIISGQSYRSHRDFWGKSNIVSTDRSKCYITSCDSDLPMGDGFEILSVVEDYYGLLEKHHWCGKTHTNSVWMTDAVYSSLNMVVGWSLLTRRDPRAACAETLDIEHDYSMREVYIAGSASDMLILGVSDDGSYTSGTRVYDVRNCATYAGDEWNVPLTRHLYVL